jgi:hypothetical protein
LNYKGLNITASTLPSEKQFREEIGEKNHEKQFREEHWDEMNILWFFSTVSALGRSSSVFKFFTD